MWLNPHLSASVQLISQFYFTKADWLLHPVRPKVRAVRVDVDTAWGRGLRFSSGHPLSVYIPRGRGTMTILKYSP